MKTKCFPKQLRSAHYADNSDKKKHKQKLIIWIGADLAFLLSMTNGFLGKKVKNCIL